MAKELRYQAPINHIVDRVVLYIFNNGNIVGYLGEVLLLYERNYEKFLDLITDTELEYQLEGEIEALRRFIELSEEHERKYK